jgi:hypothetical protein
MFVLGDGMTVVLRPLGYRVRDGAFAGHGGASNKTVLTLTAIGGATAYGCVVSGPAGQDWVRPPASRSIGADGHLIGRFGGGSM